MKVIISDEELKGRMRLPLPTLVERGEGLLPDIIVPPSLGRPDDGKKIDGLTKELVAIDGALGISTQHEIARVHGVTQTEVSFLKNGFDRSNIEGRKEDEEIKATVNQVKYNIIDKATCKLMEVLDIFEPTALSQKQLPGAAVQVAGVIERLEGRGSLTHAPNVSFHIYAPRNRHEDQYEVIEVGE